MIAQIVHHVLDSSGHVTTLGIALGLAVVAMMFGAAVVLITAKQ